MVEMWIRNLVKSCDGAEMFHVEHFWYCLRIAANLQGTFGLFCVEQLP
jgi:hypothetical protein